MSEIKLVNRWNRVTPLSKYLAMVLFVSMPFVGGWVGYEYALEVTALTNQEHTPSAGTPIVREIMPGGYVINNSLFYSPELDLAFTGRLNSLVYRDGLFYEDRPYEGRSGDAVTKEDIMLWDYIKVFPKVSTEQSPEDVLIDLIRTEGKDPAHCLISAHPSADIELSPLLDPKGKFYILNRDTSQTKYPDENLYKILTQEEVFSTLKKESKFASGKTFPTFGEYQAYCGSETSGPECMWDYDDALGIKDANTCSTYAYNSSGGFFLFSDGETSTYEGFGLRTDKRNEMPFFFIRHIRTKDTSPWLWGAVTDVEFLLR